MEHYDIGIVGAGLFGSIVAHEMVQRGKRVLVIEKRNHIGGNCYTKNVSGINVHVYGAHIFRTSSKCVWEYMQQFCEFNNFINSPVANFRGQLFNLPFNMNTFYQLWGTTTPEQAKQKIAATCVPCDNPKNLEEHILALAGSDIYEKLVKGYTEKQWGRPCTELPPSIMRRIPFRFRFDNNYFNDTYQGIPVGGYTAIFEKLLAGVHVKLNCEFENVRQSFMQSCDKVIYTGTIDSFYNNKFGALDYRSLRFEHTQLDVENYQGVAVMNFTDAATPYTRIIEHKHFEFGQQAGAQQAGFQTKSEQTKSQPAAQSQPTTVISKEFPVACAKGVEPYYPMEDEANQNRYKEYAAAAAREENVFFGGRLGEYRYYDMQDTIKSALNMADKLL